MRIKILIILFGVLLSGCYTENIPSDKESDEKYLDYQAQQAYDDWQVEKQAQRDEELAEEIFENKRATMAWIDSLAEEASKEEGCTEGCTYQQPGCNIKGNISFVTGEKIYHVPGGEFYDETIINTEYGERWFCSEEDAKANGWRKAQN